MIKIRYAVTWTSSFRHLAEVEEVIFDHWSGKDTLINSFKRNRIKKTQRIILNLTLIETPIEEAIIYINKAKAEGYNIAVQIWEDKDLVQLLNDNEIDFMFLKFAGSLDRAYSQALMGASDVYVVENLGFRIKDLQYIRKTFGVRLRVIPNIAQISSIGTKEIDSMQKFWIRPEDTEIYEPYVDVFELYGTSNRLSVVYEIYKERRWFGDLDDIILDFNTYHNNVPNGSMPPHVGRERLNCGQACFMGKCNLCTQFADLAVSMENANIEVRRDKYKPEKTEEEKEKLMKQFEDKLNELRSNEESV